MKGRYTCGRSGVMSSGGASTVALRGGFRKQARERRLEVPFTAALCSTLLYFVLLKTCKTIQYKTQFNPAAGNQTRSKDWEGDNLGSTGMLSFEFMESDGT